MNTNLSVEEYAKRTINNMGVAKFFQVFRITENFEGPDCFDFMEYLNHIITYMTEVLNTNRLPIEQCHRILALVHTTKQKYNSTFKYNKTYVMDDFVVELWRICNGH